MRRMWWWLLAVAVLVAVGVAVSLLTRPSPNVGDHSKLQVAFTAEEQQRLDQVTISPAELAAATCAEGEKCWIAVGGVVYDVAAVPSWARGSHHGVVPGTDGTEKFVKSGHAKLILEQLPVVGRLGG